MTSEIVASFVSNNPATTENLPDVIGSLYRTVASLPDAEEAKPGEKLRPAVPVGKSITDDHLVFCETGRRLKMLCPLELQHEPRRLPPPLVPAG